MLSASVVWPPRPIIAMDTLSCTRPPCSAKAGILLEFSLSKSLPRHRDPSYALGLTSNAFRRSAAHFSGKYATPVSLFTISGRGYPVFEKSEQVNSSAPALRCPQLLTQPTHPARVYLAWYHIPEATCRGVPLARCNPIGGGDSVVCSQPLKPLFENSHSRAALFSSAALAA